MIEQPAPKVKASVRRFRKLLRNEEPADLRVALFDAAMARYGADDYGGDGISEVMASMEPELYKGRKALPMPHAEVPLRDHSLMFRRERKAIAYTVQPYGYYPDLADIAIVEFAERWRLRVDVFDCEESWYSPGSSVLIVYRTNPDLSEPLLTKYPAGTLLTATVPWESQAEGD